MYIPIVFAFDNNFVKPSFVAIASLFYYAKENTIYKVYCVISKDVTNENKKFISQLSNIKNSIIFIDADNEFDNAHQHRNITAASYFRLMLHKLLPKEEKIIYSDVDVLFNGDLSEVYAIDIGTNILACVKNLFIHQVFEKHLQNIPYWQETFGDSKYTYFNAGFLVMNLAEIRKTKIWQEWLRLSKQNWEYHDQDILNMTCKHKVTFLKPKFNASYPIRAKGAEQWDLFSKNELSETPIVYHFTASKPWNAKYMKQAEVWWNFVKTNTTLYHYFLKKYRQNNYFKQFLLRWIKRILNILKRIVNT